VVASCEHDNESSEPIKGREFLDLLSDYQLLKKVSAAPLGLVGVVTVKGENFRLPFQTLSL
jgi:hypothetical protein